MSRREKQCTENESQAEMINRAHTNAVVASEKEIFKIMRPMSEYIHRYVCIELKPPVHKTKKNKNTGKVAETTAGYRREGVLSRLTEAFCEIKYDA